ncbi:App1 family protein [Arthrobacter glacialis]|uniref:App1 family protein n=1 Tax=Arthrobacter glacialis TaxID=1664 RepID=UPI000CD47396|nr:phosphatase domain-containing protein [Arthrobacter glacialis]POH57841.1 ACP synthase [Arthrobacter glacialis]
MTRPTRKVQLDSSDRKDGGAVDQPPALALLSSVMHVADAVHGARTRIAHATGAVPTIVAYPGYGGAGWVRILARMVMMRKSGATKATLRGWRAFTSVPIRNSEVEVEVGGVTHTVHADSGGLVDVVLDADLSPGWHTFTLRSPVADQAEGRLLVLAPETTFGIVSDIDDTVMVTALPRPLLALWNTLVVSERARTPTPGMAVLYDRIVAEHPAAPMVYLSTGPWNVAPALARFLARNLYPDGVLLLTDWGPTRQRWFRSGPEHKRRNLERLAQEFPGIQWLLVGDDGQHDPEIYANFARTHAAQTAAIAIRQLSPGEALLAGGRTPEDAAHTEHGTVTWVSAPDGAGLAQQLKTHGFL